MKHIILADDDPGIQQVIQLILERAGYRVSVYANGESLMTEDIEVPDLFILDKQLSGIDGLDVCRFLKAQDSTKDIPVIMLSANPYISTLAKQAGANDYIEKPFTMETLRQMSARYTA